MVGGQAHLVQDVPPYVTVDGLSSLVVGLNKIGLRRAGYDQAAIQELMAAYRVIYRSGLPWAELLEQLRTRFPVGPAALFYEFLSTTARGIVSERRAPPGATIKLRDTVEAESGAGSPREVRVTEKHCRTSEGDSPIFVERKLGSPLLHQPQLRVGDDVVEELRHDGLVHGRVAAAAGGLAAAVGRVAHPCHAVHEVVVATQADPHRIDIPIAAACQLDCRVAISRSASGRRSCRL